MGLASHFGDFPEVTRQHHDFLKSQKNWSAQSLYTCQKSSWTFLEKSMNLRREKCVSNNAQSPKIYFWTFQKSSFIRLFWSLTTTLSLDRFVALVRLCIFADVIGGAKWPVSKLLLCFPFPCRPFGQSLVLVGS